MVIDFLKTIDSRKGQLVILSFNLLSVVCACSRCTAQMRILSIVFIPGSNVEIVWLQVNNTKGNSEDCFLSATDPGELCASVISWYSYLPCRISIHLMASVSLILPK